MFDFYANRMARFFPTHIIYYGDLLSDLPHELRRLHEFLGLPELSGEQMLRLQEAVSADSMRALEEHKQLPGFNNANTRPKVRSAKTMSFLDEMSPETMRLINQTMLDIMPIELLRKFPMPTLD